MVSWIPTLINCFKLSFISNHLGIMNDRFPRDARILSLIKYVLAIHVNKRLNSRLDLLHDGLKSMADYRKVIT